MKKIIQKALCFVLIFSIIIIHNLESASPQTIIAQHAQKVGNKAANLIFLKSYFQDNDHVKVPSFYALSHDKIWSLFSKNHQLLISENYRKFQEELLHKNNLLGKQASTYLQVIKSSINNIKISDYFFKSEKLHTFIDEAKKQNLSIIVRSTGDEDSLDISNAGGNESITDVTPNIDTITQAIKQVLCSYISEKSISQRLAAEDKILSTKPLFMPILLQHMISENSNNNNNNMPRSGVIFSTEAEGETPGITLIQAAPGRNEAVVNGLLPVDSYYVDQLFSIYPIIQRKQYRLVNDTRNKSLLEYKKNSDSICSTSTLSKEEILELALIAKELEIAYGYPIDIEFIIQNETLFLLQARPLKKNSKNPTFLTQEFLNSIKSKQLFQGKTIGIGSAQAERITNKNELIFDSTLYNAVNSQFLPRVAKNSNASKNIKAIIISEDAPATSHEAIISRNSNKPIFLFDKETVKHLKKSEPSIIDPQRGIIVTEKTIGSQNIFEQGWFAHPAPAIISIIPELLVKHDDNESFKPIPIENKQSFKDIIDNMKQENDVQICLKKTYKLLQQITDDFNRNNEPHTSEYTEQFDALRHLLIQAIQGQIHHFQEDDEHDRLKKLFFLSRIEALINQVPTKNYINNFSLSSLQKKEFEEKNIIQNLQIDPHEKHKKILILAASAAQSALIPKLTQQWENFIQQLQTLSDDDETKEQFISIIKTIEELDIMPLWINRSVHNALNEQADFKKQVAFLIDEYQQSEKFILWLKEVSDKFSYVATESFESPNAFDKQWPLFEQTLHQSFLNKKFISDFEQTTSLGRLIATEQLKTLIDTFDIAIKRVTGSRQYKKDALRIERFKTMVQTYFDLFKNLTIQKELEELTSHDKRYVGIRRYIETVENLWTILEKKGALFQKKKCDEYLKQLFSQVIIQ